MNKILNILIIVLFTVLLVNIFSGSNQKPTWLNIDFSSKNYSIPASVIVKISNYSSEKVSLNTCENIEIRKNGEKLSFSPDFCKNIDVEKNSVYNVNYQSEYEKFREIWDYKLKVLVWEKEFIWETSISSKWTISKLFTSLIYAPIYNLFIWLIDLFKWSFGWAIIFVTIIIRILLIWPQHRTMVSQRKIQALQPKIKKIQEDNKWNQQAIWLKVWELYKKEKVNPFGSCGFLFIQIPIILVLYNIILWIQDYSNTFYIYSFLRDFDFSSIDFKFFNLDLLQSGWTQWIILALVVWALQYIQVKLSISSNPTSKKDWVVLEKKSWDDKYSQMMPDPEMMNKFMLYVLPLMIWFATYTLFAWVWVYWWISTLFMIVQQIIVNKMLKKSS